MTIVEAGALLRARKVSSLELTRTCLQRIEKFNPAFNAFITVTREAAEKRASEMDAELTHGIDRGPMHGIPIAYKDLVFTKSVRTTAGSKLYADFVPDHDARIVEQFDAAGAVSVGKTGLHELAYGITSTNPHFGAVRNPWDREAIPGGSSGGSGTAVVAGMAFMAIGTDTGGSIRIPAAFCGCVGLKPTYGRVSKAGVFPLGFTLDHIGPLAMSVRDCAITFEAISDARGVVPAAEIGSLKGVRVGIPENTIINRVWPEVKRGVKAFADKAAALGATVVAVRLPEFAELNAVARVILMGEATAAHVSNLGKREMFGTDVLALLDQGRLISAVDYVNAQRLRKKMTAQFNAVWKQADCLIIPGCPTAAPKIGQNRIEIDGVDDDVRLVTTSLMRGINALGWPALSLPSGLADNGMPVGVQMLARAGSEKTLLHVGAALEDAAPEFKRLPPGLA
ncbi:MAG TPA: amidase [Bryobacteraceae bacterium]|jgi:aspartyl-tRNA(Asn)/glutamyl-tRNA(Gln) amidotransferase subunit A